VLLSFCLIKTFQMSLQIFRMQLHLRALDDFLL